MKKRYDVKKLIDPDVLRQKIVEDPQIRGKAFAAVMRHLEEAPEIATPAEQARNDNEGDLK